MQLDMSSLDVKQGRPAFSEKKVGVVDGWGLGEGRLRKRLGAEKGKRRNVIGLWKELID